MSLIADDPQDLITRLSRQLHAHDVDAFERAAFDAVRGIEGDGLIYRTITTVWRGFFHPPSHPEGTHHGKYDRY